MALPIGLQPSGRRRDIAGLLLVVASMLATTGGLAGGSSSSLSLPMSVERWDFTKDWVPILENAARFAAGSNAMQMGRLYPADCRVASTVRYEIELGLGEEADDVSASATFYDPPIRWSPLAGVATHSDLWHDAVGTVGPASSRPQLLQLPDAEAAHGQHLAAAVTNPQHSPLSPSDVASTLDVAVPPGVRIWNEGSELGLRSASPDWRDLSEAETGEEVRSLLVRRPAGELRAKGVESVVLRGPVPIADGRLAVGSALPLEMDVVGEEIQVDSGGDTLQVRRKGVHASVGGGTSKLYTEADDKTWWESVADPDAAWSDPRVQAVQSIIDAAEKSTGIKASAVNKASARPVMMLSLAFDARAEEPMLRDLPVREIKKAMSQRGISFDSVGPEKGDLVTAAQEGGMSAGGETVSRRIEAVVEGNPGEISRGQPGFTIISIAARDPVAHQEYVAALRAAEAEQVPQWWKPSSPTKDRTAAAAVPARWNTPEDASVLQRSSYRLLTGIAAMLKSLADIDQMSVADATQVLAGTALLLAALFIATLELYGRRPAALIETLPSPAPSAAAPATDVAASPAPPSSTAPAGPPPTSPGRPGGRVAFKGTVRVRRFIEDAEELHDRRKHWRALSARNAANRRASKLGALTERIDTLDRALSGEADDLALEVWLAGLDLEALLPKFLSEGFTSVSDLLRTNVGNEDLEMMGIADAELRARLLAALNRECAVAP
jgi:hypothetical protein